MSPALGTLFGDVLNGPKKSWLIRLGFLLAVASMPAFAEGCKGAAPDGSASCYLTGTYELREDAMTWLQIINPTGHVLVVYAFFFDDNEHPLDCVYSKMSANDLWEIVVNKLGFKPERGFGIAKLVSFVDPPAPMMGIVGNQRIWFRKQQGISETGLHPIQSDILREDFEKMLKPIMGKCKPMPQ